MSSTEVVTVTSTTTRFVTCTTTRFNVGPCRSGRQRALASDGNARAGPWRNTKELQLESSLETSPLFPKDHAALKKTCNTLTSNGPDGRVMLTLERITFATETKTELVTVRDPRSTISITYDGCIPPDAIDTFECPYSYGYGSDEALGEDVSPVISSSDDASVDTSRRV
ncbi:uncharacterized protein LOC125043523 [Penaeus chinensis]|uniref:uncharacterized protein LOC125043523 n=1 Tax=Penaeus chinensis TaxID=139456 RepID=UPI001FB7D93C|nr:uncharacterized protein LOC125043523 [Penaeus chinensis]